MLKFRSFTSIMQKYLRFLTFKQNNKEISFNFTQQRIVISILFCLYLEKYAYSQCDAIFLNFSYNISIAPIQIDDQSSCPEINRINKVSNECYDPKVYEYGGCTVERRGASMIFLPVSMATTKYIDNVLSMPNSSFEYNFGFLHKIHFYRKMLLFDDFTS